MKKGKYGLDAPRVVFGYLFGGLIFMILGVVFSPLFYYASWTINLGILFLLIGLYMVYSSKIGKYKIYSRILNHISINGNETVLDVGCGRGLMLNGVASRITTGKAYGVDIWNAKDQSGNTRDAVMKNADLEGTKSKIEVINSDMRTLPFEDGYFDIIVSSLAIHNLKNDEEREKAFIEIARVTKMDGRVAILDLAHIDNYAATLKDRGFRIDNISKPQFRMFPPVKVLFATRIK